MRVSKKFKIGKSQFELDFVDIDPKKDIQLFLDPFFLAQRTDPWSVEASRTIQSFFSEFLRLLRTDQREEARHLFSYLGEPNETCLGYSKGNPRGHGVGETYADRIFASLSSSKAVLSGIVEDLEDTRLFIRGIDKDLTSDMATNIIRGNLLSYTQAQCKLWGIPMVPDVASGFVWDRRKRQWTSFHTERLVMNDQPLLLVPKAVVSYVKTFTAERFHRYAVLPFLQHQHLSLNTALVQVRRRRDGFTRRFVTKKSLLETEAPLDKEYLSRFTEDHSEVFKNFRADAAVRLASLEDRELTQEDREAVIDHLIDSLRRTTTGNDTATAYHRIITGILELLFYPDLITPQVEHEIHEGRKRIDIAFDNAATGGFFLRLHQNMGITCGYVLVECKNYGREIGNPELDQLAGRFGPNRSQVGLLVCRSVENMSLLMQRCKDTHHDNRGTIIPIVDSDLLDWLQKLRSGTVRPWHNPLTDRVREISLA